MGYNYDFDITAIVLYLLILAVSTFNKQIKNINCRLFFALLASSFLSAGLDIVGGEVIVHQCAPFIVHMFNNLYYLAEQATNLFFLLYILSIMESISHMPVYKKVLILLPFFFTATVIITNPLHGILYRYGADRVWVTGPFRRFVVFFPLFYFAYALVYVLQRHQTLKRKETVIITSIVIINTTARIIQYFVPSLLVYTYSVAIGVLLLFIGFQLNNRMIDPDTGLATRSYLAEQARKYIYNKIPFTTILIRIVDYDALTNSYGIRPTETLMRKIAYELSRLCEKHELYQVSINSFAVTIPGAVRSTSDVMEQAVAGLLDRVWEINSFEMRCSYYITSIPYPKMYRNRDGFISYLTYFQRMKDLKYGIVPVEELKVEDKKREAEVELAIERAVKDKSFEVYYQPICVAGSRSFVYAEALVRLKDPLLGFVPPGEFIPISESNGTIISIGNIVLEKVCRFMSEHNFAELGLRSVEVNLSTTQCLQANFMNIVRDMAEKYNIDTEKLGFEITETASSYSPRIFTDNLSMLKEEGYKLILDDYGSGYSNLQRLVTNDFDVIKFDKDMIQRTCSDPKLRDFFEKLQHMFHSMGAEIVAEGVENEFQYEFLKQLGVDYIQGYFFSKPLPEAEFIEFLKNNRRSAD